VPGPAKLLIAACRGAGALRGGMVKPLRVLICGIPNVGKSTLINTLGGKRSTKTGDEPASPRPSSRSCWPATSILFDTPGMLWPRISVERSAYTWPPRAASAATPTTSARWRWRC
jgi:ribosome biogenesis GTPase A